MSRGERYGRIFQPGDCKPSLQSKDHDGWLLLDGRTIRRADYPALFSKLGITAETVVLPDSRDRVISGSGGKLAPGKTGGGSSVTLALENLPAHDHGFTDVEMGTGSQGILAGALKIVTAGVPQNSKKTTEKSGGGKAVDLPMPPHLSLGFFVFTGRAS